MAGKPRRGVDFRPRLAVGGKGEWREKMIVEGAWVLLVAVATFSAVVIVVLLTSEKLYDPNRAHK
jgi:hypothetical protein